MKDNMPVRGYFTRAKIFGYVLLAIAVFIVSILSYHFFTD
jgi:thiol:disulfide interchange protein